MSKIFTVVAYAKSDLTKTAAEQWIDEGNEATNIARRHIAETALANQLAEEWGIEWRDVAFEYMERYYE